MSTTAIESTAERVVMGAGGVTQARVINSEWLKLRSLRSTMFSFAAGFAAVVGFGILISALRANDIKQHAAFEKLSDFDPTAVSLRGLYLAQLAIGVLGVLVITGEYSTGMIRATLCAVPRRFPVLWAKIVVLAAATFVISLLASLLAFEFGQPFLRGAGVGATLSSPGAFRAVLGGALYLTVVGVLAVGLGFLLRNTAAAIASVFGLILVLPVLAQALPASWYGHVFKYLPMPAGTQIATTVQDPAMLGPWSGIGVLAAYAAIAVAAGAVVLRRRDA